MNQYRVSEIFSKDLPHLGPDHLLSRLTELKASAGFPLFSMQSIRPSQSKYLNRPVMAARLRDINESVGNRLADHVYTNLEKDACLVLAGQQPGLLLGPLYSVLKMISVVTLARHIQAETGVTHYPAFWMATEDHDVLEVNRVTVNGRQFVCKYSGSMARGTVPEVGRISLEKCREPLLEFLGETFRNTEFTSWLLDLTASADFSDYGSLFASLTVKLLDKSPVILIDPRKMRSLTSAPLADLAEQWPDVEDAIKQGSGTVEKAGLEPPLDQAAIFEITSRGRRRFDDAPAGFELASGSVTHAGAADAIRRSPEMFSPSAALRPVLQDAVLPVSVFLGGPSELAYLWQISPVYDVIGVRRSPLQPRISATFLDRPISRAMAATEVMPEDLHRISEICSGHSPDVSHCPECAELTRDGEQVMKTLSRIREKYNENWVRKAENSIQFQLEKLNTRLVAHVENGQSGTSKKLNKIKTAVLPGGKPQERVESFWGFLNRYGPELVPGLMKSLSPMTLNHQVVVLGETMDKEA